MRTHNEKNYEESNVIGELPRPGKAKKPAPRDENCFFFGRLGKSQQ